MTTCNTEYVSKKTKTEKTPVRCKQEGTKTETEMLVVCSEMWVLLLENGGYFAVRNTYFNITTMQFLTEQNTQMNISDKSCWWDNDIQINHRECSRTETESPVRPQLTPRVDWNQSVRTVQEKESAPAGRGSCLVRLQLLYLKLFSDQLRISKNHSIKHTNQIKLKLLSCLWIQKSYKAPWIFGWIL